MSMTNSAGTSRIAGCGAGSLSARVAWRRSRRALRGPPAAVRARRPARAAWRRSRRSRPGSPAAASDRRRGRVAAPRSRRPRRRSTRCPLSPRGDCALEPEPAGRSIGRRGGCRRSGQPPSGIVMSFAERSGTTLRRQLPRGCLAARQPFQLLGKLVEAGVDLIQRAARAGALALEFADFFLAPLFSPAVASSSRSRCCSRGSKSSSRCRNSRSSPRRRVTR